MKIYLIKSVSKNSSENFPAFKYLNSDLFNYIYSPRVPSNEYQINRTTPALLHPNGPTVECPPQACNNSEIILYKICIWYKQANKIGFSTFLYGIDFYAASYTS